MPAIDTSVPQLILQGAADTLSLSVYSDGVPAAPGVTTVGVVTEDGTTIIATGTATNGDDDAPRTLQLSGADTAELGRWTVTWETENHGTLVTYAEVVGAHLFTIAEALSYRTNSKMQNALPSVIAATRYRIMEDFQAITGSSFVPRWERRVFNGTGRRWLALPTTRILSILAVEERTTGTQDWVAYDPDDLADVMPVETGAIERESRGVFPRGNRNIRVTYTYGFPRPPQPIREAALMTASYDLSEDRNDQRAISIATQSGTTQLYTPGYSGRGRAVHRLPEVDRILRQPEYLDLPALPGIA